MSPFAKPIVAIATCDGFRKGSTHPELASRIVAFSRSANPYWTIVLDDETQVPTLDDRARSPERGQLLTGLVLIGASIPPLAQLGAQFSHADLRGAHLEDAILHDIDLGAADLRKARLGGAILRSTHLRDADLRGANMWKAGLTNAPLDDADLGCIKDTKSKFESCVSLAFAELRGAWFTGAKLDKIDLTGAHIGCREVPDYDEVGVDTSCTNFQGAQFGGGARLDDLYSDSDEMLTRAWKKNLPVGWSFDGAKVRKSELP